MLNIKVVGPGCPNCEKLAELCKVVIRENNIEAQVEKISDINKFADLGIFMTPGLLINNQVFSAGKMPTKSTLTQWIIAAQE